MTVILILQGTVDNKINYLLENAFKSFNTFF